MQGITQLTGPGGDGVGSTVGSGVAVGMELGDPVGLPGAVPVAALVEHPASPATTAAAVTNCNRCPRHVLSTVTPSLLERSSTLHRADLASPLAQEPEGVKTREWSGRED
jgi:hypothetical protein